MNAAGYEAYLVGGAVRDLLLGKSPDDYDITTNALPEQVLAVCKQQDWKTVDQLGHNFGCVVIVINGVATEVTTFRGERYNDEDMHRPAATWLLQQSARGLSRRDFTVNAMALSLNGTLYDYFGGQQDLQQKILRTVGDAKQRFHEDALRMLRACRLWHSLALRTSRQAAKHYLPAVRRTRPTTCRMATAFRLNAAPAFRWSVYARSLKSSLHLNMQAKA